MANDPNRCPENLYPDLTRLEWRFCRIFGSPLRDLQEEGTAHEEESVADLTPEGDLTWGDEDLDQCWNPTVDSSPESGERTVSPYASAITQRRLRMANDPHWCPENLYLDLTRLERRFCGIFGSPLRDLQEEGTAHEEASVSDRTTERDFSWGDEDLDQCPTPFVDEKELTVEEPSTLERWIDNEMDAHLQRDHIYENSVDLDNYWTDNKVAKLQEDDQHSENSVIIDENLTDDPANAKRYEVIDLCSSSSEDEVSEHLESPPTPGRNINWDKVFYMKRNFHSCKNVAKLPIRKRREVLGSSSSEDEVLEDVERPPAPGRDINREMTKTNLRESMENMDRSPVPREDKVMEEVPGPGTPRRDNEPEKDSNIEREDNTVRVEEDATEAETKPNIRELMENTDRPPIPREDEVMEEVPGPGTPRGYNEPEKDSAIEREDHTCNNTARVEEDATETERKPNIRELTENMDRSLIPREDEVMEEVPRPGTPRGDNEPEKNSNIEREEHTCNNNVRVEEDSTETETKPNIRELMESLDKYPFPREDEVMEVVPWPGTPRRDNRSEKVVTLPRTPGRDNHSEKVRDNICNNTARVEENSTETETKPNIRELMESLDKYPFPREDEVMEIVPWPGTPRRDNEPEKDSHIEREDHTCNDTVRVEEDSTETETKPNIRELMESLDKYPFPREDEVMEVVPWPGTPRRDNEPEKVVPRPRTPGRDNDQEKDSAIEREEHTCNNTVRVEEDSTETETKPNIRELMESLERYPFPREDEVMEVVPWPRTP